MQFAIVLAAVVAVATAQIPSFNPYPSVQYTTTTPPPPPPPVYYVSSVAPAIIKSSVSSDGAAAIVRYDSDSNPDGSYAYAYETNNGIAAQEQGSPREFSGNPPVKPIISQGSYAYTSPEGKPIAISYTADENGFHPSGDAIPTSPPIPEPILRALEYIAKYAPVVQKK